MQYIGKINKEKFRLITQDITTTDVIITEKQIEHIRQRHPNDYEQYFKFIKEIIENPDYIIKIQNLILDFYLKNLLQKIKDFN